MTEIVNENLAESLMISSWMAYIYSRYLHDVMLNSNHQLEFSHIDARL